jgi:hypothetical protein
MSARIFRPNPQIAVAAGIIESIVPEYDIKQSDPIVAAETGIGNCLSKAVLGAVLLERAEFIGPRPAVAWNRHSHPKRAYSAIGELQILNGHVQLLTANQKRPPQISSLSFNPDSTASSNWEVYDFNEDYAYADVQGNTIVDTNHGKTAGFVINTWYQAARSYQEALGQIDSPFHTETEPELQDNIIELLVFRKAISSFVDLSETE